MTGQSVCQNISTAEYEDSIRKQKQRARIAASLSTVLPGSGQLYNKQYWKTPLIWGGLVGSAYTYHYHQSAYKDFSRAYRLKKMYFADTLGFYDVYPQYSADYLKQRRDQHHLYRTIGMFTFSATYLINIVDAFAERQTVHSPGAASLMSTLVPGSGQLYNRKYWKVPVIYGGFATLLYFSHTNNKLYIKYRDMYEQKIASRTNPEIPDPLPSASPDAILRERENWRRYRDLNYIGIGLLYIMNILDANVDAHLIDYDISDDLSMKISPAITPGDIFFTKAAPAYYGVSLSIKF
jgi:hypothetical protein